MKHKIKLEGFEGTLEELAKDIGNLRYDAQLKFLEKYAANLAEQALADRKRGRTKLADKLQEASIKVRGTYHELRDAWNISKPYMKEELKRDPSLVD